MLFKDITYIDENFNVVEHANIGVRNGVIDYISTKSEKMEWGYGEVYDGKGKVLMPGLVNNHAHNAMTYLRGYGEGLPLWDWLTKKVFPFEKKWDQNSVYWAGMLGAAEMIASGTTSYTDMYMFDKSARAVCEDSGLKCNYDNAMTGDGETKVKDQSYYPVLCEYADKYGHSKGRFIYELGLHAEYTSCPALVEDLAKFAKKNDLRIHAHMSETKKETEECIQRHGMTPAAYLESLGLFDQPTNLAHCVWVTDDDIEILKKHSVSVTHCPSSNTKLGSGFAPVRKLLRNGINVCLGTDGASSNNNLDMFEEMNLAALISKGFNLDADALSCKEIIKMATVNGAIAQGRYDTGLIKKGYKADLIVLDFMKPHLVPCHDVLANIVFSAHGSDVVLTMVDGEILYRDGVFKTIDIKKVFEKEEYYLPKILEQL